MARPTALMVPQTVWESRILTDLSQSPEDDERSLNCRETAFLTETSTLGDKTLVRTLLIETARSREPITYAQLLGQLGLRFTRPRMRALCKTLDAIDRQRDPTEPELAVLVVRQSDGLPGQGWWVTAARRYGYAGSWEGAEAARFVTKLQRAAFDYWCRATA